MSQLENRVGSQREGEKSDQYLGEVESREFSFPRRERMENAVGNDQTVRQNLMHQREEGV